MQTIDELLMARLTGDNSATGNLQSLLGGSGRIWHAHQLQLPVKGSVTYLSESNVPSAVLRGENLEGQVEFYMFHIFHDQYNAVLDRIYNLLHNYRFPTTPADVAVKSCVWEWTGPDEFDEALECGAKRVRFKIESVRSAQAPI